MIEIDTTGFLRVFTTDQGGGVTKERHSQSQEHSIATKCPNEMSLLFEEEDAVEESPGGIDDESGGDEQTDCKSDESGGETESKGDARGGDGTDCKSDEGGEDVFIDEDYDEYDDNDDGEDDDEDDEELGDLPPEIAAITIGSQRFQTEEQLEKALEQAGFGDLRVVLVDGKPRLVMPSDQRNAVTDYFVENFSRWGKHEWGRCSATHKIHLPNGRSREPDLSYWGYPRCAKNWLGDLVPVFGSVPDVIIQFSWRNSKMI
jgi:hypothetical protein